MVLRDCASDYFELDSDSPYMLLVAPVREDHRLFPEPASDSEDMLQIVNSVRSDIPAVTHVDYSARVQTITEDVNPRMYSVLKAFETLTGCPMLVNTSFNVRGEPHSMHT